MMVVFLFHPIVAGSDRLVFDDARDDVGRFLFRRFSCKAMLYQP
jgi:hypothetical protein